MELKNSHRQGRKTRDQDGRPSIYTWIFVPLGLASVFVAAYLQELGPFSFLTTSWLFVIRTMWTLKLAANLIVAVHIAEATYAWFLATRVDRENRTKWFFQTLVLGVFSLTYLLKKARK